MKIVSDKLKEVLKQPTTQRKGKILVNENFYEVYNVEYYADAYSEGNVIGNAIASQLDFDLPYIEKFDSFKYFDGVWTGEEYEFVDMGTFTVFDEQDEDEFNKHITSFDNLIKFNVLFEDKQDYPKTLFQELQNICQQAGVELENTSIANGNFIVENNQFVNNESLKTVLKNICGISGTYATIKNDKIILQLKNETSEKINRSHHEPIEWKRKTYGINQIILGVSEVEGEYVLREDADDIEKNGVHKLVINDNYFAYTQDKRQELIDELFNQVKGFGYIPYEMKGEWLNYMDIGDTINIDGDDTIILRINGKSPNSLESTMSAPAVIDSSVEYLNNTETIENRIRRTEIIVDKNANEITLIAENTKENSDKIEEYNPFLKSRDNGQLSLPDCAGEDLIEFVVEGKSEQETKEYNNIFASELEQGTIASANGSLVSSVTRIRSKDYIPVQPNTTYILNATSSKKIQHIVFEYTDNAYIEEEHAFKTALPYIFTTSSTTTRLKVVFSFTDNSTITSGDVTNIEIYEPIIPGPDYPSEIKSISGIENLFDNNKNGTVINVNVEATENGIKVINQTPAVNSANVRYVLKDLTGLEGKKITASCYAKSSGANQAMIYLGTCDKNGNNRANVNMSTEVLNSQIACSLTVPNTLTDTNRYLCFVLYGTRNAIPTTETYVEYFNVTVNIGDYEPYVPYGSNYLVEKVVGKNKFNKDGGFINAFVTYDGQIQNANNNAVYDYYEVDSNTTYTLQTSESINGLSVSYFDKDKNFIIRYNNLVSGSTKKASFTPTDETKYIRINVNYDNETTMTQEIIDTLNIMLEEGSQATEYEEYKEAISLIDLKGNELRSVGDFKDELIIKNGQALINKNIKKIILDGSEDWGYNPNNGNRFINGTGFLKSSKGGKCISDHFTSIASDSGEGIWIGESAFLIINDSKFSTTAEFKQWLNENNTTVYYISDVTEIIDLGEVSIETVQSDCTLELEEELDTDMYAKYIKNNPYNEAYPTKSELKITTDEINLKVSKKVNGEDIVSIINQSAEQITLKGNRVVIESDKFNLNADGTIEATGGTIGGFSLNSEEFYTEIYGKYDFTETDYEKARGYILGTTTLTNAEKEKYDIDGNGEVELMDLFYMRLYISSNVTTTKPGKIQINSNDIFNIFSLKDGNGDIVFNLNLNGLSGKNVTVDNIVAGNMDCGSELIEPTANAVTSVDVVFNKTFSSPPQVVVTPVTGGPFTYVKGCSVSNITTTGFKINLYRTDTTTTSVNWIAMSN